MLKRPMETGHVDVAADAMRRAANRYENIPPLSPGRCTGLFSIINGQSRRCSRFESVAR